MKLNIVDIIALVLVIIGGLNWGLVGLMNYNLVTSLLGVGVLSAAVFDLVGLAAIYLIVVFAKLARK